MDFTSRETPTHDCSFMKSLLNQYASKMGPQIKKKSLFDLQAWSTPFLSFEYHLLEYFR